MERSELVHRSDSFFQVLLCFETITIVLLFFPAFGLALGSNSHEDEALYQKISSEGSLALPQHRRGMLFRHPRFSCAHRWRLNLCQEDAPCIVLKFRYISYLHFITLPCILLLSLCFGSTCTPLTLLLLRYIYYGVLLIVLG